MTSAAVERWNQSTHEGNYIIPLTVQAGGSTKKETEPKKSPRVAPGSRILALHMRRKSPINPVANHEVVNCRPRTCHLQIQNFSPRAGIAFTSRGAMPEPNIRYYLGLAHISFCCPILTFLFHLYILLVLHLLRLPICLHYGIFF